MRSTSSIAKETSSKLRDTYFAVSKMSARSNPIPLMEAALIKKLRARRSLAAHKVQVEFGKDGGVCLLKRGALVGTWRWDGRAFHFMSADTGLTILEVGTLIAVTAHTASMLED